MNGDELEQMIRQNPTMNERFLLGRLDEALARIAGGLALHVLTDRGCSTCDAENYIGAYFEWPCATALALGVES